MKMTRFIISLIATIIIQVLFYQFIGAWQNSPPWISNWAFKVLLFIGLFSLIRYAWTSIMGTQSEKVERENISDKMALDKDIRQAILDRSRLTEQHLAETCDKLDSTDQGSLAEEVRKVRNMVESFAKTLSAQPSGPGPASAGLNISSKDAERIISHDKGILAIIEEIADNAADLATNAGTNLNSDKAAIAHVSESSRRLMDQVQTRSEIVKGIR
jgi:hypothetical protein